jgi:isopropylmalate/homocitrate/citramalate synthase
VGRNFNVTRAGIHADGLLKDEEIYNIFNTQKILGRPATVAVDSHSGLAGVAHWFNGYYKLRDEYTIDKRHPLVVKMKELIDQEYENGRTTVMGDNELDDMVRMLDFEIYEQLSHVHKKK